ncbi:MAG: DUF2800 domain-containing protein, partial [Lachnospiraceae bacterium]|nr:DUF2800 domain-containing protein [Lachnospiraceae bacterium]
KISLERIVSGESVPGWKIIEGRSSRTIPDPDAAFKELMDAGYEEAVLYDKKPIPLGTLEKLVSREDKQNILAKYITKSQGKPALAPEDDARPAMVLNRVTAEDAFGGKNSYKEA